MSSRTSKPSTYRLTAQDAASLVRVDPHDLVVQETFSTLFPIDPAVLERVTASMRATGYDDAHPVHVWRQGNDLILADGHTRTKAAIATGNSVLAYLHEFADEDEALAYAVANQRNRRNLTDDVLIDLVERVDKRRQRGGDRGNQHTGGKPSRDGLPTQSAAATAAIVDSSPRKIERIRAIVNYTETTGDLSVKAAVKDGKLSINAANKLVQAAKRPAAPSTPESLGVTVRADRIRKWLWNVSFIAAGASEAAYWLGPCDLRTAKARSAIATTAVRRLKVRKAHADAAIAAIVAHLHDLATRDYQGPENPRDSWVSFVAAPAAEPPPAPAINVDPDVVDPQVDPQVEPQPVAAIDLDADVDDVAAALQVRLGPERFVALLEEMARLAGRRVVAGGGAAPVEAPAAPAAAPATDVDLNAAEPAVPAEESGLSVELQALLERARVAPRRSQDREIAWTEICGQYDAGKLTMTDVTRRAAVHADWFRRRLDTHRSRPGIAAGVAAERGS